MDIKKGINTVVSFFNRGEQELTHSERLAQSAVSLMQPEATNRGSEYLILDKNVDGEREFGSLGAPSYYNMLHESLSARSWELYADSDIAKMIIDQYVEWIIGQGLKLESEPNVKIIEKYEPNFDSEDFSKSIENIYTLLSDDFSSTHSEIETFNTLSAEGIKSAKIGGDCVIIFRYEDGSPTIEIVDGRDVSDPSDMKMFEAAEEKGHRIVMGVELGKKDEHVAYYIRQDEEEIEKQYKRVEVKGKKTGRVQAKMYYGSKYRVNDVRGLPLYAASIERLKGLDRYVEAIISGTEERAKIPFFTEHNHFSDGSDPLAKGLIEATTQESTTPVLSFDAVNKNLKLTYNKQAINMPPGSTLKAIESTMELRVGEFLKDNAVYICAACGIPYEFALMLYTDSFSASRMATQSFQHKLDTETKRFALYYHKPYYDILLETEILKGNVKADGYFKGVIQEGNKILKLAYHNARFTGSKVPSADPSKDVKASVMKIQNYLSTIAKESESLNTGNSTVNIERLGKEYEQIKKHIPIEYQAPTNADSDKSEFTQEPKATD